MIRNATHDTFRLDRAMHVHPTLPGCRDLYIVPSVAPIIRMTLGAHRRATNGARMTRADWRRWYPYMRCLNAVVTAAS